MNLTEFLKKTDGIIKEMNKEELEMFIHLRARILKETKRNEFIEQLTSIANGTRDIQKYDKSIKAIFSEAHEQLLKIQNGEIWINSSYNEMYDDWYDNTEDEFVYEDTYGITEIINESCRILHMAIDTEMYKEAYKLAREMMELSIEICGDYEDCGDEPLNIVEIHNNEIISFDITELGYDILYTAYIIEGAANRPEELYEIITFFEGVDLKIEQLFQRGIDDLPEADKFLVSWIKFLGNKNGIKAQKLMEEAVSLLGDGEQRLEMARQFCNEHPGLFEQMLLDGNGFDEDRLIQIGQEAIKSISADLIVRSRIALLTAEYALNNNDNDMAEQCWVEAYRSYTTPLNFLRVAVNSSRYETDFDELIAILNRFSEKQARDGGYKNTINELCKNTIDDNTYYTLMFFNGKLKHVIENGMNVKHALGWSGTFMKQGIALFLLHLFAGEELPSGCGEMCSRIVDSIGFTQREYVKGNGIDVKELEVKDLFWSSFLKWKSRTITDDMEIDYILDILNRLIEMRVEGIMQNNRRRYYGECAAYIAALGEVQESLGKPDGKQKFMEEYKKKYIRRSAFRAELRRYGYMD